MGLYMPGDMARLCEVARPSIGVVTAVRAVHLYREVRGSFSADVIAAGKRELVEALPATGTAVLNPDDPLNEQLEGDSRNPFRSTSPIRSNRR